MVIRRATNNVDTHIHSTLTGNELHPAKFTIQLGPPNTTPAYTGQSLFDYSNGVLYVAKGTTDPADWISQAAVNKVLEKTGTTYTVVNTDNGTLLALTNVAARAITLPANPQNGFTIGFQDFAGTAETANITITAPGSQEFNISGDNIYKIVSDFASVIFVFDSASTQWLIYSSFIGYQPIVQKLRGEPGLPLILETEDTNPIQFNVNNVNALTATTTQIQAKKEIVVEAANKIKFNNSDNTFYSSIQAGNNSSNLIWTLPTTAPFAGQIIGSSDTNGTLQYYTVNQLNQTTVGTTNTPINALTSDFSSIVFIQDVGFGITTVNGIVANSHGKEITIINSSDIPVFLANLSEDAAPGNQILSFQPNNFIGVGTTIYPGYSIKVQYNGNNNYWNVVSQISAGAILGSTSIPDFQILGEELRDVGTRNSPSSGEYVDLAIIIITAGVFEISAIMCLGATGGNTSFMAISLYSGNITTDHVLGDNVSRISGGNEVTHCIPSWCYNNTALSPPTRNIYLKYYLDGFSTPISGRISAVRRG